MNFDIELVTSFDISSNNFFLIAGSGESESVATRGNGVIGNWSETSGLAIDEDRNAVRNTGDVNFRRLFIINFGEVENVAMGLSGVNGKMTLNYGDGAGSKSDTAFPRLESGILRDNLDVVLTSFKVGTVKRRKT